MIVSRYCTMRSIEEESGYFVLELGESLRTRECFASSDLVLDWEHLPVLYLEPSRINTYDHRHPCPYTGLIWHLPKGTH